MNIRLAIPADAEAIASLNRLHNTDEVTTPDEITSKLSLVGSQESVIVAESDHAIIGFATVRLIQSICYPKPWAELAELYVDEAYRRQGIGRAIIHFSEQVAIDRGATDMSITTNIQNYPGQGLYRSQGYEQQPHIVFQKSLQS